MSLCGKCSEKVVDGDGPVCAGECKSFFHYACSGISETNYRKLPISRRKTWKCVECTTDVRTRTPSTNSCRDDMEERRSGQCGDTGADIKDIKHTLTSMNIKLNELSELRKEVEEIRKFANFIDEKYENMKSSLEETLNMNRILQREVAELKRENLEKDRQMQELFVKVTDLDQYSRNRNLEIIGVEERPGENCLEVVKSIAEECGVSMEPGQIDVAHRVPSKNVNMPRPIIVQFVSRNKRDELLVKKKLVTVNNSVNGMAAGKRILINEHLSPYYRNLLSTTKKLAREKNFKYVWFKRNTVFVRKTENGLVKKVFSESDLSKVFV